MVHNLMMPPKGKASITLQRAGEEDVSPWGWGGYSDIRRLGLFLGVQILIFFGGRGVQKDDFFFFGGGGWGYDDTAGIFGGPSQNWTIFGNYF